MSRHEPAATDNSSWEHSSDTTKIDGGKIYTGTIQADKISGTNFDTLTLTSGKIDIETTDGLEISGSGNMKVTGGCDIDLIGSDSDPGKINFKGTSYSTIACADVDGNRFIIEPSTSGVIDCYIGTTSGIFNQNRFDDVSINASSYIFLNANSEIHLIGCKNTTTALQPITHKTENLGLSAYAWDEAYADNWNNVADFYWLDEVRLPNGQKINVDDVKLIEAIKPSNKVDTQTGMRIINDSTLPVWLVSRHKQQNDERVPYLKKNEDIEKWRPTGHWHWVQPGDRIRTWKAGDIATDPDGKPYLATKTMLSLLMGAIRRLDGRLALIKTPNQGARLN